MKQYSLDKADKDHIGAIATKLDLALEFIEIAERPYHPKTITVTFLTKECGVHRNTFYYHFSDIPDLIIWTIRHSFGDHLIHAFSGGHEKVGVFISEYMNKHIKFLNYACKSLGDEKFSRIFRNVFRGVLQDYIPLYCKEKGFEVRDDYHQFLVETFSGYILSLYMPGIRNPDDYNLRIAFAGITSLLNYMLPIAVQNQNKILPESHHSVSLSWRASPPQA